MPYVLAPYEYVEKNIWWLVLVRIARLNIVGQEYIKIRDFLKFFILLVYRETFLNFLFYWYIADRR